MTTILSEVMLYAKVWSPELGLVVLIALSVFGAIFQIITSHQRASKDSGNLNESSAVPMDQG